MILPAYIMVSFRYQKNCHNLLLIGVGIVGPRKIMSCHLWVHCGSNTPLIGRLMAYVDLHGGGPGLRRFSITSRSFKCQTYARRRFDLPSNI